jgi:DNA polymerase III subunit gamma/tau
MTQALYRKWRPIQWEEVIGQDHVIRTLKNAVRAERVAHAYLFAGPRGTGKTTSARLLAKAVNCLAESPGERPDNTCRHCLSMNEGRFLDLIEIDAASNTSVEDVRELRDKINFSPNEGRHKIYIIDEVHMLSTAAFNALLKTLEEPPAHAIFILATTEVHKIPATVLSRCQRHEFRRLPMALISSYLLGKAKEEETDLEDGVLDLIARQATGSLRDAISIYDQLTSTGDAITLIQAHLVLGTAASEAVRTLTKALAEKDSSQGLGQISQALDGGADPRQFARQTVEYLRGLLLIKMGSAQALDAPDEMRAQMASAAERFSLPGLLAAIRAFDQAAFEGRTAWLPSLPLELAFLESMDLPVRTPGAEPQSPAGTANPDHNPVSQPAPPEPPTVASDRSDSSSAAPASEILESKERNPVGPSPSGEAEQTGQELQDEQVTVGSGGPIDLQDVYRRWKEILGAVRRVDPRTQALLNTGKLLGIEDQTLVIGFKSDLLREKMESNANLEQICLVFEQALGQKITLRCVLLGEKEPSPGEASESPIEPGGMVATVVRDYQAQVVEVKPAPRENRS